MRLIQKDVESLLAEREELIASVADKSNEIAELKAKLCEQSRMDNIYGDLKHMTLEQAMHSW